MKTELLKKLRNRVSGFYFWLMCLVLVVGCLVTKGMVDSLFDFAPDPVVLYQELPVTPLTGAAM